MLSQAILRLTFAFLFPITADVTDAGPADEQDIYTRFGVLVVNGHLDEIITAGDANVEVLPPEADYDPLAGWRAVAELQRAALAAVEPKPIMRIRLRPPMWTYTPPDDTYQPTTDWTYRTFDQTYVPTRSWTYVPNRDFTYRP